MKKFIPFICVTLLSSIIFMSSFPSNVKAENISVSEDRIRVFIGTTAGMDKSEAKSYLNFQNDLLVSYCSNSPHDISSALITFNDFLTIEEVSLLINRVDSINTLYIWIPNHEGRAIIDVKNDDIKKTINDFFSSLELDKLEESEYKIDMLILQQNYGIFALDVTAEHVVLKELSLQSRVRTVDIMQNPYAQKLSYKFDRPVSYICIPEKPDGTA